MEFRRSIIGLEHEMLQKVGDNVRRMLLQVGNHQALGEFLCRLSIVEEDLMGVGGGVRVSVSQGENSKGSVSQGE